MSLPSLFDKALKLSPLYRRILLISLDLLLVTFSLWLAIAIRLESLWPPLLHQYWWLFPTLPILSLPFLTYNGLYRTITRYSSLNTLWIIFKATGMAALILIFLVSLMRWQSFPRSAPFLFFVFSFLSLSGYRLLLRYFFIRVQAITNPEAKKVIIYGAGSSGAQISSAFKLSDEFIPVAFIDDDPKLQGRDLNGIKIYAPKKIPQLLELYRPDFILLAMPSESRRRIKEILDQLASLPIKIKRLPYLEQLISNQIGISDIQDIEVEDLLGREPIPPKPELLEACIRDKAVMVTGAGGSIGSELCRQIARLSPKQLILFEHSEYALYKINSELKEKFGNSIEIFPILGSVCNYARVKTVISTFKIDTLYHAAAYKHVPLVEFNPIEGIQNNLFGTLKTAMAAQECGVKTFLLISTDKAVRPTNIMGASKRIAELVLQAFAHENNKRRGSTLFTMVRFGNVLGSSGSVVPLFKRQISQGGPITVTHPEITRYFMTIPEAVELVIQAGSMAKGGEVFVLDMGEPIKIVDLAQKMIALSGLSVRDKTNPDGDIEIVFTGLRPGEKLYEELLVGNNVIGTRHPMIMRALEDFIPWSQLQSQLNRLEVACHDFDLPRVKRILMEIVEEYQAESESVDPVWLARVKTIPKLRRLKKLA